MDRVINLRLLAHPMNYLIVLVVVAIGAMGLRELGRLYDAGSSIVPTSPVRGQ